MGLSEIINVIITRQTTAVSRAGFGIMLIATPHVVFTELSRSYAAASAMLDEGFESTDPAYIAANAAFSQNPKPTAVKIGRRQVDSAGVSVDTAVDSIDYTVTINGTDFTFNSGVSATEITIATGLVGVINGGAEPVTANDDLDGTFTVDADVPGVAFSLIFTNANMSHEKPYTAVNTVAVDLAAINLNDADWYALVLTSRVQADAEAAALWISSELKIFITASNDADILDSAVTTDLASVLEIAAYDRAAVMYSASPETFPDAAWLGKQLPKDPGSSTWMFKTLSTIPADSLTLPQSTNARNKNANVYETIGGVNMTLEGIVASGEYLDIIRGVDWLQARMTERIFGRMVNLEKVPFTDAGVAIVEAEIKAQLNAGIDAELLAADPAFTIDAPLVADVDPNDKIGRLLPDMNWKATLSGAIHAVEVAGVVTL